MAQPLAPVQIAGVALFRGDSAMQAAMTGATAPLWNIFDNVPVYTSFPYLYVGDMQARIGTALAINKGKATDIHWTLHIFSQAQGWKEVQAIVDAIDNLLNMKTLSLTGGFTHCFCLFEHYMPKVEKDGITRHGAVRYKLMITGG